MNNNLKAVLQVNHVFCVVVMVYNLLSFFKDVLVTNIIAQYTVETINKLEGNFQLNGISIPYDIKYHDGVFFMGIEDSSKL